MAPTTSSMATPPTPKVVWDGSTDACPPAPPVQLASKRQMFAVEEGYDELIVEYYVTGEGQVTPGIRYVEENKYVWGGQAENVNSAPTTCGSHGAHPPGDPVKVEPGQYEGIVQYTGSVSVTFIITARSTRDNMTDHGGHMGG